MVERAQRQDANRRPGAGQLAGDGAHRPVAAGGDQQPGAVPHLVGGNSGAILALDQQHLAVDTCRSQSLANTRRRVVGDAAAAFVDQCDRAHGPLNAGALCLFNLPIAGKY